MNKTFEELEFDLSKTGVSSNKERILWRKLLEKLQEMESRIEELERIVYNRGDE